MDGAQASLLEIDFKLQIKVLNVQKIFKKFAFLKKAFKKSTFKVDKKD